MGDNRSYAALDWVVGEIGESLKQARQALEAYVENTEDTTRIRFCLTHIHQVHGSLQMVEFYGAALLAEEMESLAQALMNKSVRNEAEGQEVLMRAILQLPVYLEQVKKSKKDSPNAVLPLLNDLRAVRGEALLTETKLFSPNLAPAHHIADKNAAGSIDQKQFKVIVKKLRQMYQYAAASVIQNVKREENIGYLYKVFSRLRKLTQGTARQPLWDIALALLEGLEHEAIESSASVKSLLRQIDKEISEIAPGDTDTLSRFTNDELIKNLLYYIAGAAHEGKYIKRIKDAYNLKDALPVKAGQNDNEDEIIAPDLEAIQSVVSALKDELDAIKHALDVSLTDRDKADVNEAIPIIKRVADTMAVLGIGDLRKQMLAQGKLLESVIGQEEISPDVLMEVAGKIIVIENSLELMARGSNKASAEGPESIALNALDQAHESVLRESRNGLEQAKDAIIEYIASQWDRVHLGNVPAHLLEIAGGLDMIPLHKPAAILTSCANYVREQLLEKDETPEWSTLDTLADAIASVEYYLERITGDRDEEDEMLLSVAEESVQTLGYPVSPELRTSTSVSSHGDANMNSVLAKIADVEEVEIASLPDDVDAITEDNGIEFDFNVTSNTYDGDDSQQTFNSGYEVETNEYSYSSFATGENPAESVESFDFTQPMGEEIAVADTEVVEDEADDLIDDEILEIFLEEAEEVLETINEFFPLWASNFEDGESLIEFRRAFHTLKGSGRMVNANDIGELSWSVENMLNRVLDKTIEPNNAHTTLIQRVIDQLPGMIQAFRHRIAIPNPVYVEKLAGWAEELSTGGAAEELFTTTPESYLTANKPDALAEETGSEIASYVVENEDDDDSVLWEIFGSEALTHLDVVKEYIAEMDQSSPLYTPPSDQMQRALHTLKGSAHMADVTPIAELVTPLERFVKELRNYQVAIDADILQLIRDCVDYTQLVLQQISNNEPLQIPRLEQYLARVAELKERSVAPLIRQTEEASHSHNVVDPQLLSIFMAEEMTMLLDADELVVQWSNADAIDAPSLQAMTLELETLAKGAEHANLPPMATLSRQLNEVYDGIAKQKIETTPACYQLLTTAHAELLDMIDAVAVGQSIQPVSEHTSKQLADVITAADDVVNTIPTFGSDHHDYEVEDELATDNLVVEEVDFSIAEFNDKSNDLDSADVIGDMLVIESDDFSVVEDSSVGENNAVVENSTGVEDSPTDESDEQIELNEFAETSVEVVDVDGMHVGEMDVDGLDSAEIEVDGLNLSDTVNDEISISTTADDNNAFTVEKEFEITEAPSGTVSFESTSFENTSFENTTFKDVSVESETTEPAAEAAEEVDLEIFEIFIEEADELLEEIDGAVHDWESDWSDNSPAESLKRTLHTLKGGARLAGLMGLGDLAHEFESFLITKGENVQVDDVFFGIVHEFQDKLINGIEKVKSRVAGHLPEGLSDVMDATANEVIEESRESDISAADDDEDHDTSKQEVVDRTLAASAEQPEKAGSGAAILPFHSKAKQPQAEEGTPFFPTRREFTAPAVNPGHPPSTPMTSRRTGPQELVKVSAELLEELVNLAGETSISRGRLEEQNSEVVFAIDEMESTVNRLQEQLRRLDIETEAQMIFRQEQMQESEEFDPLEMDRYSQLQQLSRSLMESASDLMDLTSTLNDKTRGTETLLLQQSRINTDLQEGLMRSRMVPFSRLVPRLRRIVRQISTELGKHVSFELDNIEGEMDRSVLERMVAPLEHMLRNAVDHGIEPGEERLGAGKPQTGRIVLSLGREGGDIIMRLVDDGRGLNLEKIRAKAVERGLMAPEARLSDHDVMQFILHAGFSTADKVTQISGRGVGMDVVHAEIKKLGGSMFIDSRWGHGTEFTIRLPFTVSVNRALMIQIGDDNYAIPLNTIEGIVRVSPFELEHYYQDENARFEYAGENYRVRYLGTMLNASNLPRLEGQSLPIPVVLVRTTEHAMAIQVDKLMGSREIVVKSLGLQFAAVEGLSGATVMGDGSVVVILDPHAMIRKEIALLAPMAQQLEVVETLYEEQRIQTIMVVDDSVTVRKVTSRFLEREGYEVLLAKDGADALLMLQDRIPDAMLLDIEMPRMDGFEVAKNIRSSSRLRDIPIIMITSRTGEKHRERALSLGVNKYMGKPYQEEILLGNIRELIGNPSES